MSCRLLTILTGMMARVAVKRVAMVAARLARVAMVVMAEEMVLSIRRWSIR